MPVFRLEKTTDYTVMSNHHLRNSQLSLKAKGLLSQILSLPEDWDYTLRGLAQINAEGIDSIRAAIHELEEEGYISRSRVRDENGRLGGCEYVVHEAPVTGKPTLENPTQVIPTQEKPTQLNKDILNKETQNKESYLFDPERCDDLSCEYECLVKSNISYDALKNDLGFHCSQLDEIVGLMVEVLCSQEDTVRIACKRVPIALAKSQFLKLNIEHIRYVLSCLSQNTSDIRNIKQYLLTTLFNAPNTMSNYYAARVNHDLAFIKSS